MNIAKMLNRISLISYSKIVFKIFVIILAFSITANAQGMSSDEEQWRSVGGKIVASGEYQFKESDPANGIRVGAFMVQGPGYIGMVVKKFKGGGSVGLRGPNSSAGFVPITLGEQVELWDWKKGSGRVKEWKWYPPSMITEEYTPNANKGGWVTWPTKDKPTTTLEVWVGVEGGGVENEERAIQYEYWYFPLEGGKIISSTYLTDGFDKPQPGILYYTDKNCE